jgi:hypothetical protein
MLIIITVSKITTHAGGRLWSVSIAPSVPRRRRLSRHDEEPSKLNFQLRSPPAAPEGLAVTAPPSPLPLRDILSRIVVVVDLFLNCPATFIGTS